jgi:hypothetical protein
MAINRIWIWLTLLAAVLMAASNAAGIFLPGTYARETASWASQGAGQDIANLFFVFPAMLVALHFAYRGSVRATLVWLGLLIYIIYSYTLYAFFVHFNSWFLVYVAVLGLSTYALFGSVIQARLDEVLRLLAANTKAKATSVFLFAFGFLFGALWLSEIVPSLLLGKAPRGIAETGLPVNPVHVLDLAFVLPGMILTAASLRKRNPLGLLFAAPFLTFSAVMGTAILSMFCVMNSRGVPISLAPVVVISVVVLDSVYAAYSFLREIKG